eukprot:Phypoly_transcript_04102.p1 GENE.Phypoly_transcript_04102~~Phypoly_transcript_04102.p1  ORF type:complete len:309 (-),score=11.11 Phypoly_transcript_04102:1081-2007(-)
MIQHFLKLVLSCIIGLLQVIIPSKLEVTKITLCIPNLMSPIKVVHLSDLHYDHPHTYKRITKELLEQTIATTNNELADLVVITGDFVQFAPEPSEFLSQHWLSQLKSRYGVYGVLGNHDLKEPHSKEFITKQLTRVNISVLDNEVCFPMGDGPGKLMLVGFCDYTRRQFKIEPVEQHLSDFMRPKLILSHNPDSAELLRKYRADVILAGHTHGGQILIPFFGTPLPFLKKILPAKFQKHLPVDVIKNWDWLKGLHHISRLADGRRKCDFGEKSDLGINYLYTNRGLATHPPLRFNCNPEITILELIPI